MPAVETVIPVLPVRDLERAHRYYCDVLGFVEPWGYGEPLQYGGVQAEAGELPAIHFTQNTDRTPGEAYILVGDVDAYFEQVKAAGAEFVFELADRDYGMRDFMVKDPDGNQLSFGADRSTPAAS
jgi:uncharacterized glyoxalase superfamily protein PhnB